MPHTLVHLKAKCQAAGHLFLGWIPKDKQPIKLNGPIQVPTPLLQLVTAFATEAELSALFVNVTEESSSSFLKKLDILNIPQQFTVIIPQPLELQMSQSRNCC